MGEIADIGGQIKTLRLLRGESRMDLAKACNVDPQTVGRWERGQRTVHPGYLMQIAAHFNVSPSTFGLDEYVGEDLPAIHDELTEMREQLNARMSHIETLLTQLAAEIGRLSR